MRIETMCEITFEQLVEWQALWNAALPGPWKYYDRETAQVESGEVPVVPMCDMCPEASPQRIATCDFIIAAQTAVPLLIAEVLRLNSLIDEGTYQ